MSSRFKLFSLNELERNFDKNLKNAVEKGEYPNVGDGLSPHIFEAITEIAKSYPDIKPEMIKEATRRFEAHLDWLTS